MNLPSSPPLSILTDSPTPESLHASFITQRYIAAAFLALLYYDHVLTLREETELVWPAANTLAKYALLLFRYGTLISVTLIANSLSGFAGDLSTSFCKRLFPGLSVLGVIYNCFGDVIAMLHIAVLWRRDRIAIRTLLASFCITTLIAVVCIIVSMVQLVGSIAYDPHLNICSSLNKPLLLAAPWVAGLCFDLTILILIFFNSLRQGVSFFQSTGTLYFSSVLLLRLFNLLITTAAPLFLFGLIASVAWPCFSINLSHFVFRLRQQKRSSDQQEEFQRIGNVSTEVTDHHLTSPRTDDIEMNATPVVALPYSLPPPCDYTIL